MQNPDMYGPFWVATTLVFVTAVAGNYADYAAFNREAKSGGAVPAPGSNSTDTGGAGGSTIDRQWYTDYAKVCAAAVPVLSCVRDSYAERVGLCMPAGVVTAGVGNYADFAVSDGYTKAGGVVPLT